MGKLGPCRLPFPRWHQGSGREMLPYEAEGNDAGGCDKEKALPTGNGTRCLRKAARRILFWTIAMGREWTLLEAKAGGILNLGEVGEEC